ncbi:MAG: TonB-dependent receptor plug domain-containing protein [Vitreoscilla sp.]
MKRRALASVVSLLAGLAVAQEPQAPQRVEIVGSRIPRIDAETAVPVQIITHEDIARSGVGSVEELLDRVSANFGGQHEAMGLGNADTPGFAGASLRGFGTGETLVLLNGRRLANYAFTGTGGPGVDLHVIPLAAIQRVEILKDGASALYGSDAIAGVINFVTRQDYTGAELALGHSATEHGGGGRSRASLAAGLGDPARDGFNVFGVLDASSARSLRALQRSFTSTGYRPELGLTNLSPVAWPANIQLGSGAGRSPLASPAAPACTPQTVPKAGGCFFDPAQTLYLLAPSRQLNGLGRGTLRLGGETELYAEVLAATSRIQYHAAPSPAYPGLAPYVLPESSAYYPTGLGLSGDLTLAYRAWPLGGRRSEVESDNLRVLAGMRSRIGAWDLDGAASVNETRARERYLSGYIDSRRLSDALATGLVNPFGPSGAQGDALLQATQIHGESRDARGSTRQADLRASSELVVLPGGSLAVALGVEARHESLRDREEQVAAEVVGGGLSAPKQGSRSAQAGFAELDMPLLKGLDVQAAVRFDHYSDFGGALDPKLAIRLQPQRDWLLRASIGRGFRAPSLPELYTQQTSSTGALEDADSNPVPDPLRCPTTGLPRDCQLVVQSTAGGNPALRPQRSTQANAGLVLEPARGWHASLDFWRVDIHDIISTLAGDTIVADLARYDGRNVIRGPVDPAYPTLPGPIVDILTINQNLGDWRVDGADLALATQRFNTVAGAVSMQLDATWTHRARQNISQSNAIDLIGRLVPRCQTLVSVNLDHGAWSATLSHHYRRGYTDEKPLPDESLRHVSAYQIWDGQLGLAWSPDVRWTVGIHNLLDTRPPFTNSDHQFQVGYDPIYADPLGRTWSVGLRAAWR